MRTIDPMEHSSWQADGERPGGDAPRSGAGPASVDGASFAANAAASSAADGAAPPPAAISAPADSLSAAAAQLAVLDASVPARHLLAEILTATLAAFTLTRSTRDPLPDTAPGSPEESLAVIAGLDHLRSSLAALDASWLVEAERRITRSDAEQDVVPSRRGKGAAQEIALARRTSPSAGSYSLAAARRLIRNLPGTTSVLRAGRLTSEQASTVSTTLDGASPETCAQVDQLIAESPEALQGRGSKRLASDVRAMIQQLEPEGSRERAERAARARHVTLSPRANGMAQLGAILPALDATAVAQTLRARARSIRADGSRTPVRALEADLLVEAVLSDQPVSCTPTASSTPGADAAPRTATGPATPGTGGDAGTPDADAGSDAASTDAADGTILSPTTPRPRTTHRPRLDVGVVITDSALFDREDESECAVLEGYGSIPAHIITDTLLGQPPGKIIDRPDRTSEGTAGHTGTAATGPPDAGMEFDEQAAAVFRQLYRRPRTGDLVAMESRARTFPVGLGRLIRWRDVTCRTPWCNAVIRQIDHIEPHHRGGPTSLENGQGLCVRCNLAKELGLWNVRPIEELLDAIDDRNGNDGGNSTTSSGQFRWESPHGAVGFSSPLSAVPGLPGSKILGSGTPRPRLLGPGTSDRSEAETPAAKDTPPVDEDRA